MLNFGKIIVLLSVCLLFLEMSHAHQKSLRLEVCKALNVGHRSDIVMDPSTLAISLVNSNGEHKDCFEPGAIQNISIRSLGKPIYGLLMLQDSDKVYDGELPWDGGELPSGLKGGFCDHSVSHRCIFSGSHQRATKCNLTNHITFPYKSPSDRNNAVELRYSIVFTYDEFFENKKIEFRACPKPLTVPPPTPSPNTFCNVSDFEIKDNVRPLDSKLCPNNPRWRSHEVQTIFENGMHYTCRIDGEPVRKKSCATGCMHRGNTLCCRVKNTTTKLRNFTCIPEETDFPNIKRKFLVTSQRKCECFNCQDVCPTKEASGDLAPLTTEDVTNVGNDGNDTNDISIDQNTVE